MLDRIYRTITSLKLTVTLLALGVVLLLFGQLLTDVFSTESLLHLRNDETRNFSEASRQYELVIVDTTDATTDKVVAIPERRLLKSGDISHPEMPFTVRVKTFYP